MYNNRNYPLAFLMLEFFALQDMRQLSASSIDHSLDHYTRRTIAVTKAAKKINHEALTRYLSKHSIPHPWVGEGSLE